MFVEALIFLTLVTSSCYGDIYSTADTLEWEKANSSCNLTTPKLIYTDDSPAVDMDTEKFNNMWVGYVKASIALLYIGCSNTSVPARNYTGIKMWPGICYSLCQTTFIGIGQKDNTCYCIQKMPKDRCSSCSAECEKPKGTLCGETVEICRNCLSVYRKVQYPVNVSISTNLDDSNCLILRKTLRLEWASCTIGFYEMCWSNEHGVTYNDSTYLDWADSMKACLKRYYYPLSAEKATETDFSGETSYWTGVIRVEAILPVNGIGDASADFNVGYTKWTDGKMVLAFEEFDKSRKRQAVCENDDVTATTALSADRTGEPGSNVAVLYVLVTVGIVIASVLVVVGFILRRRCKEHKISTLKNEKNAPKSNAIQNMNKDEDDAYELAEYSECVDVKHSQAERGNRSDDYYDTANTIQSKPQTSVSIYNKLEISQYGKFKTGQKQFSAIDDTYSHVTQNDNRGEDTYNHVTCKSPGKKTKRKTKKSSFNEKRERV